LQASESSPLFQSSIFFEGENTVNPLRFRLAAATCTITLLFISSAPAQEQNGDKLDLGALTQIKNEAFQHSQVMENLFYISEVYGPRVNNSRNHRAAAEWAMQQMKSWGLQNVHLEKWGRWVADQEVLRSVGIAGIRLADRVSPCMDAGNQRTGNG
jgi:hypothetical protein